MKNPIKQALTRKTARVAVKDPRNTTQLELEIPPSQKLLYGIYFAITALAALTALETTYMIVFQTFNNEIFATISLVIGTILGTFFGQKA